VVMDKTHGPITPEFRELMNRTARALDEGFKGAGFVLLLFDTDASRANYISNRDRATMLVAMKELIARFEGRGQETDTRQ